MKTPGANRDDTPLAHEQHGDAEKTARREFIKKVGKAGVAAPAVALLVAANFKSAQAQTQYGGGCAGCGSGSGTGCGSGSGSS